MMKVLNEKFEFYRKFREYETKIIKMAGYLTDNYIDRAIETDDFSHISGFLIDYFSGPVGKPFDIGYLVSKYKECGLDEKIEDIDFDIDEWYRIKYEIDTPRAVDNEKNRLIAMSEEDYIDYMIEKRKKESEDDDSGTIS